METREFIRPSILVFAAAMERKLQGDDDTKPPWETERLTDLFNGLLDEVEELADAHLESQKMEECCDIALYAMMIFSKLQPETYHLVRGRGPVTSPFMHGDRDRMPSDRAIMKGGS